MIVVTNVKNDDGTTTISISGDMSITSISSETAMTTIINSTSIQDQTVVANTTYILGNEYTETVDVPIFQPQTLIDILNGVYSRGLTVISQHG